MLTFIFLLLIILLIVGLKEPGFFIRWHYDVNQKLFVFYWAIVFIFYLVIAGWITKKDAKDYYAEAETHFYKGQYYEARNALKNVSSDDPYRWMADDMLTDMDSLEKVEREERKKAVLEKKKSDKEKEIEQLTASLKREIKAIDDGVNFSEYRGSVESLQFGLVLFATWANLIQDADPRIEEQVELASTLEQKVKRIQIQEFPKMRKEYVRIVDELMWEHDIEVEGSAQGTRWITFTGGTFASNGNIKDFQTEMHEVLKNFRFLQSRYKWYEHDDEVTYYELSPKKDSDLVDFK
ncbi:hypothetical protein [Catalinimonas niigatensis]|uniref:hypothetical protein n=1 Tax=Catalinimonas niigatensis TaxID=1397264 RepID=UPI00266687E4|nr:hypothetical protein [Catalinimonas niigatensis]WPP53429.1 hypothetical protein PZB72_13720 [Catalinimonas niigatensis]